MLTHSIRFDDGAAYQRYMGHWSRLAGELFLDSLAPAPGLHWLDIGCGNGAFTELLIDRCAPASVVGIDPSEEQLAYARTRFAPGTARFHQADAMALPFESGSFDAAIMPLVIFFVPEPARGVAEMARVVRPGGQVSAYAWDMIGGGFPYESLLVELYSMGLAIPVPPSPDASQIDTLQNLWATAGLDAIQTQTITVRRTFTDFEDYWTTILGGPSVGKTLAALSPEQTKLLRSRLQEVLPADEAGQITYTARANAVKGRVARAK